MPFSPGAHGDLVAGAEHDQRAVADRLAGHDLVGPGLLDQHAGGRRGITERAFALEHVRERIAPRVHRERLAHVGRHPHVEIGGSAATPSTGPRLPQKSPVMTRTRVPSSSTTSGMSRPSTSW